MESEFIVIVHNVRSAHNVGSIFRTADGVGADLVCLSGYSPTPMKQGSIRATQAQKMLAKTALGAEKFMEWKKISRLGNFLEKLLKDGFEIVALEQVSGSHDYRKFRPRSKTALIVGNEPKGINSKILKRCDAVIEIPMRGKKNSLNVSVAFGIAAYEICSKIK